MIFLTVFFVCIGGAKSIVLSMEMYLKGFALRRSKCLHNPFLGIEKTRRINI